MTTDNRTRWLALLVLCLGDLMIVLDVTIVGVALPSIRRTSASPRRRSPGSSTPTCSRSAASSCSAGGSATSSGTGACS